MCVCDLCDHGSSTQERLKSHRESVHHQSACFSCQVKYVANAFYRKDHLGRHMKIHQSVVEVPLPRSTERRLCVTFAPRRTERRLCVTFAPRRSLVRKRIDRPFIVNLAAFRVECAADAFTEETTSRSITSENMPTRSTKCRLVIAAPFVRRASTNEAISEGDIK